jgi:hypothetical protein
MAAVEDAEMVAVDAITAKRRMRWHSPYRSRWPALVQTDAVIAVGAVTAADAIAYSNRPTPRRKAQHRPSQQHRARKGPHANPMRGKPPGHAEMGRADAKDRTAPKIKPPFLGERQ